MSDSKPDAEADEVVSHSYTATLHAPLFYGSKEGSVIETEPTVAATALMHALGYEHYGLEKAFLLRGEDATTPAYERLRSLPFFVSEMVPDAVDATERTFRTTSYATERTITSQDVTVGEFLVGSKNPVPRRIEGSNAGWHRMREYVGLAPGSTFQFTVWALEKDPPPQELGFRVGIKRTGEVRARKIDEPNDAVSLNHYLLTEVYNLDTEVVSALLERSRAFRRGNDIRTSRFLGVDKAWVDDELAPIILGSTAE